jgi:hypothetical protein
MQLDEVAMRSCAVLQTCCHRSAGGTTRRTRLSARQRRARRSIRGTKTLRGNDLGGVSIWSAAGSRGIPTALPLVDGTRFGKRGYC